MAIIQHTDMDRIFNSIFNDRTTCRERNKNIKYLTCVRSRTAVFIGCIKPLKSEDVTSGVSFRGEKAIRKESSLQDTLFLFSKAFFFFSF